MTVMVAGNALAQMRGAEDAHSYRLTMGISFSLQIFPAYLIFIVTDFFFPLPSVALAVILTL